MSAIATLRLNWSAKVAFSLAWGCKVCYQSTPLNTPERERERRNVLTVVDDNYFICKPRSNDEEDEVEAPDATEYCLNKVRMIQIKSYPFCEDFAVCHCSIANTALRNV